MKYAKVKEDKTLEYAPRNIPGISNWIEDESAVLAAGYLPVVELVLPEGKYISGYEIKNGEILPILKDNPPLTYIELRRQAYPPISDQLDMIYWDKINGTNIWQETVAKVKSEYPKAEVTTIQEENREA
nr:MAG TPA: hypothetical protein [Caudoviricetes sp.]